MALKSTTGAEIALAPVVPAIADAAIADAAVAPGGSDTHGAAVPAAAAGPITIPLKNGRIMARIESGVVTLSGQAATLAEKMDVSQRIAAVPGVVDVINTVTVQTERQLTDAELASALGSFAQ